MRHPAFAERLRNPNCQKFRIEVNGEAPAWENPVWESIHKLPHELPRLELGFVAYSWVPQVMIQEFLDRGIFPQSGWQNLTELTLNYSIDKGNDIKQVLYLD